MTQKKAFVAPIALDACGVSCRRSLDSAKTQQDALRILRG
eukprot:COSAG06_NODE_61846_length_266_cov_1.221557_1_plen_39_part_10